jgi:ABC-2 type transport system ATP-binding protein
MSDARGPLATSPAPAQRGEAIIAARGLTKRFGDFTAVDDLTLTVERGSIFAFLGSNGSGKSTTIRMLIGLLRPTAGEIELDGVDVIHHPRRARDRIGYMGQKVSLYQGLSLRENVEFYAGLDGLAGAALEQRWGALRERFELGEAESEQPQNLPAGLRQRAGLAVATLHHPPVLFLDEPTAGVDVHNRARFWDLIREEAAGGVTVFVTTHFLEEADYCDRAAFIDAGRLIANAAPEELRRQYSSGYRIRIDVPAAALAAQADLLRAAGFSWHSAEGGVELHIGALDPPALAALQPVTARGARVQIEQPAMGDVFRRLAGAGAAA